MSTQSTCFSRGQLAKHTQVNANTIRYYETYGLLPKPARTPSGHRRYTADHAQKLIFIRRCREADFSLTEINELMVIADNTETVCKNIRDATARHLNEIQKKIKHLMQIEQSLQTMIHQCSLNTSPSCPIIETLSD